MAKSPHFIRIKGDVMAIIAAVPSGAVVSFRDIGAHLDVEPRHVAYILSNLTDIEKTTVPWHRAVGENGALGAMKLHADGRPQAELLRDEGGIISAQVLKNYELMAVKVDTLAHNVPQQKRPANLSSPQASRKK